MPLTQPHVQLYLHFGLGPFFGTPPKQKTHTHTRPQKKKKVFENTPRAPHGAAPFAGPVRRSGPCLAAKPMARSSKWAGAWSREPRVASAKTRRVARVFFKVRLGRLGGDLGTLGRLGITWKHRDTWEWAVVLLWSHQGCHDHSDPNCLSSLSYACGLDQEVRDTWDDHR